MLRRAESVGVQTNHSYVLESIQLTIRKLYGTRAQIKALVLLGTLAVVVFSGVGTP